MPLDLQGLGRRSLGRLAACDRHRQRFGADVLAPPLERVGQDPVTLVEEADPVVDREA